MSDCIFCKIINGDIPSTKVYEDDKVVVIEDINPCAKIHLIAISKVHIRNFNELTEGNSSVMVDIVNAVQKTVDKIGIKEKGYRIINNCGKDAGQTVDHIHFHIIGGQSLSEKLI